MATPLCLPETLGISLVVSVAEFGGFDFADARPHRLASDPVFPNESFPFLSFCLLVRTATVGSLTGGSLFAVLIFAEVAISLLSVDSCFELDCPDSPCCGG